MFFVTCRSCRTCNLQFGFFHWLVVYLPLWKIWKSNGIIVPNIWKNIKCSKPPTSSDVFSDFFWSLSWTFPFITSHHCGGLIWNAHVRPKKSSTALFCLQAPRLLLDPWPPSWKPFVLVSCDDFNHPQWWIPVGEWSPTRQLVGGWPTPLKNISSSLGVMTFPTEWKVIKVHGSKPPTRQMMFPRLSLRLWDGFPICVSYPHGAAPMARFRTALSKQVGLGPFRPFRKALRYLTLW